MVTKRGGHLLCLATFALVAGIASAQDLSKPVIVVNGQGLSYGTYYHKMERLNGVGRLTGDKFIPAQPGFLTLQEMINDALMIQLAVQKGVAPTDKEIDAKYADALKQNPDQVKSLLASGVTEDDIRDQFRITLSEFKLTTMGINIGDQQVEEYYNGNPNTYTVPKRWELYLISVANSDQEDAVDKELNSRQAFPDVAKKYSLDLSGQIGGYMGPKSEDQLIDSVKKQVTLLGKNDISPWIDIGSTKLKFWVSNVYPAKLSPLTPELREAIRERLMVDRGGHVNDIAAWMSDMRKNVKFDFQGSAFDNDIKVVFQGGS